MSIDHAMGSGLAIGSLAGSVQTCRVLARDIRTGQTPGNLTEAQRNDLADGIDAIADFMIETAPADIVESAGKLIGAIMGGAR